MLLVLRDPQDRIRCVVDYYLVNESGQIVFDGKGTHLWMERFEVSQGHDAKQCFREVVRQMAHDIPHATDAYWIRKERSTARVFSFSRSHLLRFAAQEEVVV